MVPMVWPSLLSTLTPISCSPARYWLAVWPLKKVLVGIATLAAPFLGSPFGWARVGAASAAETSRASANLCMTFLSWKRLAAVCDSGEARLGQALQHLTSDEFPGTSSPAATPSERPRSMIAACVVTY